MDLDDEELKATRRMNGSDKNVVCIAEDIKDLEKYISFSKKSENFSHDTDWKWNKELGEKMEHLIKAYKELKQENRKLSKANETYIRSIQSITPVLMNDYIEKSLVEEKIEELKQEGNYKTLENPVGRVHFQAEPCDYKIQVLKELLEGE